MKRRERRSFWHLFHPKYFFMDFARVTGWPIMRLILRPKCYYEEGKKKSRNIKGRAIIISNHRHWSEAPLIIILNFWRRIHIITAKETYRNRFVGLTLKGIGGIPIHRDKLDIACFHRCIDVLNDDKMLLIFPEGKLSKSDEIAPFKSGMTLMALKTGTPIIPVYIIGPAKFYHRAKMMFGKPIRLTDYNTGNISSEKVEELTQMLHAKMVELKSSLEKKLENRKKHS